MYVLLCYLYLAEQEAMTTATMLSYNVIIIIVVTSVVVLFISNCVVVCICFYLKYKQSVKTSERQDIQLRSEQLTSPIYATAAVVNTTLPEQDLKMIENVAYVPVNLYH